MAERVTIQHLNQNNAISENILITALSDLIPYFDAVSSACVETFVRLMKENISPEQWKNHVESNQDSGLFFQSICEAEVRGNNPVFNLDHSIQRKLVNFTKLIVEKGSVMVNKNGGFCYFNESIHQIISRKPYMFNQSKLMNVTVRDNTTYINLENDPILEKHTVKLLSELDPNYSFITCLRKFSVTELTDIFTDFKSKGGQIVYVYTTGSDVPQMHDYAQAIINAKLSSVEFEFNAGYNPEFDGVISLLKEAGVKTNFTVVSYID